ncbi:MAG TPA: serine hydrolase [Bacteroidales bacterium]|nr:serine hydrolase [Bacteroidales bacterium]
MKRLVFVVILFLLSQSTEAQNMYFPPLNSSEWETTDPALLGWCTDNIAPLYNYLESIHSKAFIVLKDGKIVLEKYFGTFTADSIWYWASAGKTVTSFMVGLAQQEGFLSINDTVSEHLGSGWTSCQQEQENKITVRNQLTMTTGFDDGVPDNYCTLPSCLICLADPGTRWAYHNAPYTLLDDVLSSATGMSLNLYLYQKITLTTGISGLFLPSGYNNVFYSIPRSMARFGLLVLNHGVWDGHTIMSDTAYYRQMTTTSQQLNLSYGYLWWLNGKESFMVPGLQYVFPGSPAPHAPADMISGLGKNGQFLNVVPSQNIVTVRLGNAPGEGEVPFLYNDSIWQKLNDVICNPAAVPPIQADVSYPEIIPNPSNEKFSINWPGKNFEYTVYDSRGRRVLEHSAARNTVIINSVSFHNGLYLIRIKDTNGRSVSQKLVISH